MTSNIYVLCIQCFVTYVFGVSGIGLILDRFRISELHRANSLIVPILKSVKQLLQRLTGLRITPKQIERYHAAPLDSEGLVPCRLPSGWYMIEATPDAESLGRTLIIECFSDKNASISTGKQMMQLGNTRITKRIIHVEAHSCCIRLTFNIQILVNMMPAVSFARLSRRVAFHRMQRAVRNACVERILEAENDCTAESQTTLEHLYKSYCERDAEYKLAYVYYAFSPQPLQAHQQTGLQPTFAI